MLHQYIKSLLIALINLRSIKPTLNINNSSFITSI